MPVESVVPTPPASFSSDWDDGISPLRGRTRHRGQKRKRDRAPLMASASQAYGASVGGGRDDDGDQSSPQRRRVDLSATRQPNLPPPSPEESRSRKRSPSPTRQQAQALRDTGKPRVCIETDTVGDDESEEAHALWIRLRAASSGALIPKALQKHVQNDAHYRFLKDDAYFSSADEATNLPDANSVLRLWHRLKHILRKAHDCDCYSQDENAWSEVVRLVLRTAICDFALVREEQESPLDLEVVAVQSQTIDQQYLPRYGPRPGYCNRKTDFAVGWAPQYPEHRPLRERMAAAGQRLSHLKDPYTSTIAIAQPVEVKAGGGSAEEARLQLGVFCASALKFLSGDDPPPVVGWTVVGHQWTVFLAWKHDVSGSEVVEVRAPPMPRSVGTSDLESLMALLQVLRSAFAWLRNDYWPRFCALQRQRLAQVAGSEKAEEPNGAERYENQS